MSTGKTVIIVSGLLLVGAVGAIVVGMPADKAVSLSAGGVAIQMPAELVEAVDGIPFVAQFLTSEEGDAVPVGAIDHSGAQTSHDASTGEYDFVACRGL